MALVDIMIDQLGSARRILEDGQKVVPSWLITTPEGRFLILAPLESETPETRERAMYLISRFMTWKLATSFVLTAESSLPLPGKEENGEDAILAIGVSRNERIGLVQRSRKRDPLSLTSPEWLNSEQIEEFYSRLLPSRTSEITLEEIAELTATFGDGGKMQAERLS